MKTRPSYDADPDGGGRLDVPGAPGYVFGRAEGADPLFAKSERSRRGRAIRLKGLARGDLVSGVVLAGLGVSIVLQARRWEYVGPDGPGPGFFPLWYGVAMIGLAAFLVARTVVQPRGPEPPGIHRGEIGRALRAWAALAVCVGLLKILGFLVAFALFTFFVTAVMYRRPVGTALAVAVGCTLAFYLLFPLALNVALPVGRLGF